MQNHVFPTYSLSEKIADGTMHVLGVAAAITGATFLAVWTFGQVSGGQTFGIIVYGLALIATFMASAIYNMNPWERARPVLRRFDHAAIYLKIAGTYTPIVVMIGSLSAYLVLITVWLLAAFGVVRKLFFWHHSEKSGTWLYLTMGWLSVALIWPLLSIVPASSIWLIATGGLLYTVGVIFYAWKTLKFSNAIWHGFVVAASTCFYIGIVLGLHHSLL